MKNISENRRGKFEQAWQDAFDGKEMGPTPDLWQNLDRHLANQESKKYRKGIFVYKWIAAASIVIAIMVSTIYFYNTYSTSPAQITEVQPGNESIGNETTDGQDRTQVENNLAPVNTPGPVPTDNSTQITARSANPGTVAGKTKTNVAQNVDKIVGQEGQQTASRQGTGSNAGNETDKTGRESNSPTNRKNLTGNLADNQSGTQPDNVNGMTGLSAAYSPSMAEREKMDNSKSVNGLTVKGADLNHVEPEVDYLAIQKVINFEDDPFRKKEENGYGEALWAGVNVSSGYFDPNFGSERGGAVASEALLAPSRLSFNDAVAPASVSQENSGGQSFTFGFSMGKRIAKKWVLQSGINYLNYSSDGSTNAFYELSDQTRAPASSLFNFANAESLNLASSVINFDNQFEFLSIPVQAGYVLLDKKVGLVLSAGVGTDFFLNNKVSPDSNGLEDFNVKPGEESPYRTIYFNGLMGTQLRYRFSKHYSFTFEPSYSIAINSFSKSDSNLNSFPNVFRLGVGLKYHFR